MARTRERSASPGPGVSPKRLKVSHPPQPPVHVAIKPLTPVDDSVKARFAPNLFEPDNVAGLHNAYRNSEPYKHAVVDKLFQDDLLVNVKDECLSQLSFTEKETDIYKVNQTGDLASLNYLSSDQLARLPNLLALRDSLYSKAFREFLQTVTGCGPLSGTKQDMSVNTYTRGCHLLNHDDVIGTRRVSYILYMPLPHYQMWQKEWGGALELYPTKVGEDGNFEPESIPSKCIPPSWNQFIFFEVQPGQSFHSVEEVVVGGDGRERLSISGWFHAIQEGEEGYLPEPPSEYKSSREQLQSTSTNFTAYPESDDLNIHSKLSEEHVAFLSEFLNPVYLQPRTMKALAQRFVEESSLELHSFLAKEIADPLESRLLNLDVRDGLGPDRAGKIPAHTAGVGASSQWELKGPPHKWRYCTLAPRSSDAPIEAVTPRAANPSADANLRSLQDELFTSAAFREWLSLVTKLIPMRHSVEARRFRPGLDYTLATSEEGEARLDVVLGLTPRIRDPDSDEDGNGKGDHASDEEMSESGKDEEMEEEEDSTLLTVQPGYNRLLLVLRDERVMRFVKYVSAAAESSRWDICGEYEIGMIQEEGSDGSVSS